MAHSLPYPISYVPATPHSHYLFSPHPQHHSPHIPGAVQLVSAQMRADHPQRKRPKYTRSKTGCLTCRGKKIKCDETKPKCSRCAHGQRECTWPELIPTKKKPPTRKTTTAVVEERLTADSASRDSDSTPSSTSRDATPNSRDAGANLNTNAVGGAERRNGAALAYPYPASAAQVKTRQPHQMNSLSPASSGASADFQYPSPSLQSASPYGVSYSSNSSTSSRSNSRPSTASSLPPSRLSGSGLDSSTYHTSPALQSLDSRNYSRWDSIGSSHPEVSSFMYHSAHDSDIMSRHYSHEHANGF